MNVEDIVVSGIYTNGCLAREVVEMDGNRIDKILLTKPGHEKP